MYIHPNSQRTKTRGPVVLGWTIPPLCLLCFPYVGEAEVTYLNFQFFVSEGGDRIKKMPQYL